MLAMALVRGRNAQEASSLTGIRGVGRPRRGGGRSSRRRNSRLAPREGTNCVTQGGSCGAGRAAPPSASDEGTRGGIDHPIPFRQRDAGGTWVISDDARAGGSAAGTA